MKFDAVKNTLTLIALFIGLQCYAQTDMNFKDGSRVGTSYYTYIYKISNEEAEHISLSGNVDNVDNSFFHTQVDYFPTDSVYNGDLPQGHYLKVFANGSDMNVSFTTVQDFDFYIINNDTDLRVRLLDGKGEVISDADVRIRNKKKLHFDEKTQLYIDKKSNKKGMLRIYCKDLLVYYDLNRDINGSGFKRTANGVLYASPVKYVWKPIRYVVRLPIDGVRTLTNYRCRPVGAINSTKYFFQYRIENWYNRTFHRDYDKRFDGYMLTNKPKYMPGDTVKFKAYIYNKNNRKLYNDSLNIYLSSSYYRGYTRLISKIASYNEGGYAGEFALHDSLDMTLDRTYYIRLSPNGISQSIMATRFEYEDYELSALNFSLGGDHKNQYKDSDISFFAKGTDENELNIMDGRLLISARVKSVDCIFDKKVFVPDTLFSYEKRLDPKGDTEISISDSLFPKANFTYYLEVKLLTSDNDTRVEDRDINYKYKSERIEADIQTDSILVQYFKNDVQTPTPVWISAEDNFGNKTDILLNNTPCKVALEPYYSTYYIKSDSLREKVDVSSSASLVKCYSERTEDSIYISVENPRKIPFTYNIYKKSIETERGYSDSLNISYQAKKSQRYFVALSYLWCGKMQKNIYEVPLNKDRLSITVSEPKLIYPGQKTRIEVSVTDINNEPVEGVDLTAYSLTKKFDYSPPTLPDLPEVIRGRGKKLINNFQYNNVNINDSDISLDYNRWNNFAGLDSITYYQFCYPGNSIFRFEFQPEDSLTQFAPFVMSKGKVEPVRIIYIDEIPVYFSWSTFTQPYSFMIDSGYHNIKLRTRTASITIDSLYFNYGKKLVFSLDADCPPHEVDVIHLNSDKDWLSYEEKRNLMKYVFPYRNDFDDKIAYLSQGNKIQLLNTTNRAGVQMAGPLVGDWTFNIIDGFSHKFTHEPFYVYEFKSNVIKMKSIDPKEYRTWGLNKENSVTDLALTKERLLDLWQERKNTKREQTPRYKYPKETRENYGRLRFDLLGTKQPLNILLTSYDDFNFMRVYQGSTSIIHNLERGYYRLIFLYPNDEYQTADSVFVERNGVSYCIFNQESIMKKDTFSARIDSLIETLTFKESPNTVQEETELRAINTQYMQQYSDQYAGRTVSGQVLEADTGEPIVGVTVMVEGTEVGTITDLNGNYILKVPHGYKDLIYSFIGFDIKTLRIGIDDLSRVEIEPLKTELQEVVVVGYGVASKQSMTASVVTVDMGSNYAITNVSGNISQSLQGSLSGVQIESDNSGYTQIMIRGASTETFDKKPLYIIDGNVFTGDISELDASKINGMTILKDAQATSLYGARGANGVVILNTKGGAFTPSKSKTDKGADYDDVFFEAASQANSLRNNFSDYAFWQPSLITDKDGKASFETTFPDDVTSWETFYLAMNGTKQSAQTKGLIKSYKPLMAQLSVPRFMVQSDEANIIGKVLNYTSDTIRATTEFEIENNHLKNQTSSIANSFVDTLTLVAANEDSISVKFSLTKEDGYFDGEKRDIPVYPLGLETTIGNFYSLDKDTSFNINIDPTLGTTTIYARADILDVIEDEIQHVRNYKYLCNEQLASKLKALLAAKQIASYKGVEFEWDKDVNKIIKLLLKHQNERKLWGWWNNSDGITWISNHVMEALYSARDMNYKISINQGDMISELVWKMQSDTTFENRLKFIKMLRMLDAKTNFKTQLDSLSTMKELSLNERLQLAQLRKDCNVEFNTDFLNKYRKTTMFGNVYYSEDKKMNYWRRHALLDNDIQNTMKAYKLLKSDSSANQAELTKMRNYVLEKRGTGHWLNTYESAQIIETILPDLLKGKTNPEKAMLIFEGDMQDTILKFPYEHKSTDAKNIKVTKTGDFPIYFSAYQKYWDSSPKASTKDFEISTEFEDNTNGILTAGKEVTLRATVKVLHDADYVMINIPIPASCSYSDKSNSFRNEVHREYFRNETTIFCKSLSEGEYKFKVKLIPRYTGKYTLNPAKAELMYFPTFFGNNKIKKVEVK